MFQRAVRQGRVAEVEDSLNQAYDLNQTDSWLHPVFLACDDGHIEIAKLLLAAGAYPDSLKPSQFLVRTPLTPPSIAGYMEICPRPARCRG